MEESSNMHDSVKKKDSKINLLERISFSMNGWENPLVRMSSLLAISVEILVILIPIVPMMHAISFLSSVKNVQRIMIIAVLGNVQTSKIGRASCREGGV